jgi:hypothetical protein
LPDQFCHYSHPSDDPQHLYTPVTNPTHHFSHFLCLDLKDAFFTIPLYFSTCSLFIFT